MHLNFWELFDCKNVLFVVSFCLPCFIIISLLFFLLCGNVFYYKNFLCKSMSYLYFKSGQEVIFIQYLISDQYLYFNEFHLFQFKHCLRYILFRSVITFDFRFQIYLVIFNHWQNVIVSSLKRCIISWHVNKKCEKCDHN